eukprot:6206814-Pleurochrysis_carterae.AAC.3
MQQCRPQPSNLRLSLLEEYAPCCMDMASSCWRHYRVVLQSTPPYASKLNGGFPFLGNVSCVSSSDRCFQQHGFFGQLSSLLLVTASSLEADFCPGVIQDNLSRHDA